MNLPSIKTLSAVFGANAKRARQILEMSRGQLEQLPECDLIVRKCYHSPETYYLRMIALDALAKTFGVEAIETRRGWCDYLNTGETYKTTLMHFNGRYIVGCWGDMAEKYGGQ